MIKISDKIEIRTDMEACYLISKTIDLDEVVIVKGNKRKNFIRINTITWKILAIDIAELMNKKQEDRVYIYYGKDMKQFSTDSFEFSFMNSPIMCAFNTEIYVYLTLDNKLRFIWNQHPSAKRYVKSNQISNIEIAENKIMNFCFCIVTRFIPINKMNLITSHRQRKNTCTSETTFISSTKNSDNTFNNYFSVAYDIVESVKKVTGPIQYDHYCYDIIDFGFTIQSDFLPLTAYITQIDFSFETEKEFWFNYSEECRLMTRFFKNAKNKVSARIGLLNNPEAEYLRELEKNQKKVQMKKKKKIILIMEYPHRAQESGLIFFKYMMDKQKDFVPYYIVSKSSKDLAELEDYMTNVLFYKSKEHIEKMFETSYLAHTHTPNYAAPVLTKIIEGKIKSFKNIFLQHGIIGVRNLEYMYGKNSNPELINKFVVSSKREFNIVRDELCYSEEEIILAGLPRFDSLLEPFTQFKSFLYKNDILIMPSWRKGQENLTDGEFKKTLFFKSFHSLINNQTFERETKNRNLTVNFFLHNNFQKYNHLFKSSFVHIIESGEQTVQNLLKKHGILITDYSSVGLDFSILFRPVLYYQFDNQLSEQRDLESGNLDFLPGKIFHDENLLLEELYRKNDLYKMDKEYKLLVKNDIYQFRDRKACQRIFRNLQSMNE